MFATRNKFMMLGTILDFTPLDRKQKSHLTNVYLTLGLSCLITALTVIYNFHIPEFLAAILLIGSSIYLMRLSRNQVWPFLIQGVNGKRLFALVLLAVCQGVLIKELVYYAHVLNPEILTTALFVSIAIFFCFSLGAIFATKRISYYLWSITLSLLSFVSFISFWNIFIGSKLLYDVRAFCGLIMYAGFVAVDTQITLADFNAGNKDFIVHAIALYLDLIAIFIKILRRLVAKEEEKEKKKNNKKKFFN